MKKNCINNNNRYQPDHRIYKNIVKQRNPVWVISISNGNRRNHIKFIDGLFL